MESNLPFLFLLSKNWQLVSEAFECRTLFTNFTNYSTPRRSIVQSLNGGIQLLYATNAQYHNQFAVSWTTVGMIYQIGFFCFFIHKFETEYLQVVVVVSIMLKRSVQADLKRNQPRQLCA
jgi:hypothetical protein